MEYEVIIGPGALRDLDDIRRHISRDNPEQAERFCQRLLDTAATLRANPKQGAPIPERPGARFLVMKSYLLVYRVVEEPRVVRLLRFWHGARDRGRLGLI